MTLNPDSLERLDPNRVQAGDTTGEETLRLHLERYRFAAGHLRAGRVLDIACGAGYGTRELCDLATVPVTGLGVDISESAIDYARAHYEQPGTEFQCADAMVFRDDAPFENIVSIETIEHLPNPTEFVDRIVSLLAPGGVFIASVPTTPSVDANPYHLHDFTPRSFRRLFEKHQLEELASFGQDQPFSAGQVVKRSEDRMQQVRSNLLAYYLKHPSSLVKRVVSTVRHGFKNKYLTVVWRSPLT